MYIPKNKFLATPPNAAKVIQASVMKAERKQLDGAVNSTDWREDTDLAVICVLVEPETVPSNGMAEFSSVHVTNISGPRTEPCGTPY